VTSSDWIWLGVAAGALVAVCGGLWVDWKLNWGRRKEDARGFDVVPRDPHDDEDR
jgi:hypothetical protein